METDGNVRSAAQKRSAAAEGRKRKAGDIPRGIKNQKECLKPCSSLTRRRNAIAVLEQKIMQPIVAVVIEL
jgi:hypothetical protein